MIEVQLTARHRSMLRAVAAGRGQLRSGSHPAMSVDGLWCDFTATNVLVGHDLIRPAWPVPAGGCAPAVLTQAGITMLATLSPHNGLTAIAARW